MQSQTLKVSLISGQEKKKLKEMYLPFPRVYVSLRGPRKQYTYIKLNGTVWTHALRKRHSVQSNVHHLTGYVTLPACPSL